MLLARLPTLAEHAKLSGHTGGNLLLSMMEQYSGRKSRPFGAPRRQRQHRIEPIERLNRGLFVRREHGGMLGRVHVQPDHIRGFGLEVGIIRLHVPLEPARAELMPLLKAQGS